MNEKFIMTLPYTWFGVFQGTDVIQLMSTTLCHLLFFAVKDLCEGKHGCGVNFLCQNLVIWGKSWDFILKRGGG